MSKSNTPAVEIDLRIGAKAKKLISTIDKPQSEIQKAVEKASDIARGRGDRILRDYYLYQALGMEMPPKIKEQWEHFEKTGKEMVGAGAGEKKTPAAQKTKTAKKDSTGNPPSGKESFRPDPKPSGKQSGGQSKSKAQSGGAKGTQSSGSTKTKSSAQSETSSGLPSSD